MNDKEKVAGWMLDLNRILQVFNVRSIVFARLLLTLDSQTELAINTHAMVSDIYRIVVKGQEANYGKNLLVSDTRTPSTTG